jgi:hypothetical protein
LESQKNDGAVKSRNTLFIVIPGQSRIQCYQKVIDTRLAGMIHMDAFCEPIKIDPPTFYRPLKISVEMEQVIC